MVWGIAFSSWRGVGVGRTVLFNRCSFGLRVDLQLSTPDPQPAEASKPEFRSPPKKIEVTLRATAVTGVLVSGLPYEPPCAVPATPPPPLSPATH